MSDSVYASPDELRLQVDVDRSVADPVLVELLQAASRVIDGFCNRPDGFVAGATATTRLYPGSGREYLLIDECVEIISVVQDGVAYANWHGYRGSHSRPVFSPPYIGILLESGVFAWTRTPSVAVTARWGYADEVPPPVKQATIVQAARWWMRGRSAWADASMPDAGMGVLLYRKSLDPDIAMMLERARFVLVTV